MGILIPFFIFLVIQMVEYEIGYDESGFAFLREVKEVKVEEPKEVKAEEVIPVKKGKK